MNEVHSENWRKNIQAKAKELQIQLDEVLGLLPSANDPGHAELFQQKISKLIEMSEALHEFFAKNLIPESLKDFTRTLQSWRSALHSAEQTRKIAGLYRSIGKLGRESADESSFTTILNKHLEDADLQGYLEALIVAIERLLIEGDESLTKQMADELQVILDEIRRRRSQSLPDLEPWVEWALISLGSIFDSITDLPIGAIAASGVLAAKKSNVRIRELFKVAHREHLESLLLKGRSKFWSPLRRKLLDSTTGEIEAALRDGGGLASLDQISETKVISGKNIAAISDRYNRG